MTSEQQHWISAAVDNQALATSELDALLNQAALQQTMVRYQLIGAIMRGESGAERALASQRCSAAPSAQETDAMRLDFAQQFAAVLMQEPVHTASADTTRHAEMLSQTTAMSSQDISSSISSSPHATETVDAQVIRAKTMVKTSAVGRRWWQAAANQAWLKVGAQGAIAASVALVAVFGINQHNQQPDAALTAPLPVFQTMPVAGTATPVSLNHSTLYQRPNSQGYDSNDQVDQQRRLTELMQLRQQQIRLMEQAASRTKPAAAPDDTVITNDTPAPELQVQGQR